ncbi:MAG: Fic family protein [Bacteroidaceae bacterium]|nr:Fic family protein [Bacteroidaceae bacterium]
MATLEQLYTEWKSLQPLKDEDQLRLNQKFMLEFNYNSNHIEGNTLTYGQTELLLLFGKVVDAANMKDLEDMKASNVGLNMMKEQAQSEYPLTETFIRQLHQTILREDYTVYRQLPGGQQTSYVVHAGIYKTRPNSVITRTGERFEYASPEETPALMTDLIQWYNEEEQRGVLSLAELCALFHYRYIRIHPFEDGNGRIARLLVNFILYRHDYPMIVVQSSDKENYLNALSTCDGFVGTAPSTGSHAEISQIGPFVEYIEKCMERALNTCIKAAKGQSIEEDDDFMKELKILERQKKQDIAAEASKLHFSKEEVWNILEYVYFPLVEGFEKAIHTANDVFRFSQMQWYNLLSKTKEMRGGLHINQVMRGTQNSQIMDFVNNAQSMWFGCELMNPMHPTSMLFQIEKRFYITFFEDHYFVDGILNKNFPYGKYPTEEDKQKIVAQFKKDILEELKEKM